MYVRYLVAVLRFFGNTLDRTAFQRAQEERRIDLMAQIFQALSLNHLLAGSLLDPAVAAQDELAGG